MKLQYEKIKGRTLVFEDTFPKEHVQGYRKWRYNTVSKTVEGRHGYDIGSVVEYFCLFEGKDLILEEVKHESTRD